MAKNMTFTKAKKKREELQLPILHFIVADDWIDKLGMDAFRAWLKMYTWCDRTDVTSTQHKVPRSLSKTMKALGVHRNKFYNKIIKPLWNYGLIDLIEYKDSKNEGQKPMNIIVFDYPQNNYENAVKPLKKVRDYDTEYVSTARTFILQSIENKNTHTGCSGKEQGEHTFEGCSIGEHPPVPQKNTPCSMREHNNDSNSITNDSNDITNDSNHHQEEEELPHFDEYIKEHSLSPEEKEMMMTRVYERRDDIQAKNKTARYRYYDSVLQTIRDSIRLKDHSRKNYQSLKKDKLPKWLEEKEIHEKKQYDGEDEGLEEKDLEKEKKEFEKLLRMRKKKRTEEYKLPKSFL